VSVDGSFATVPRSVHMELQIHQREMEDLPILDLTGRLILSGMACSTRFSSSI
jgi:hypothetical protein